MRQRRLKNEINVVPYIDVMLVLLVIFMVTAPMMTAGSIDLPSVGKAAEVPMQPLEVSIKENGSLVLTNRAKGSKSQDIERKQLKGTVKALLASNPQQPVLIAGDKKIPYGEVLSVMDELRGADVKRVGLLVQPTGK